MSRELLKQALDALKTCDEGVDDEVRYRAPRFDSDKVYSAIDDIESALEKTLPEPVTHQFQDTDESWHDFINPDHYKNTVEDGRWPIRALYAEPLARKELTIDEIIVAWNEKADQYNQWESLDADEMVNFVLSVVNANAKRT
jgi:hypothetical protein